MNATQSTNASGRPGERGELSCWEALADILSRETALYRELSDLCDRERQVLTEFSTPELLDNNSRKETILLKAKLIDEARIKLVGRIAGELGLSPEGIDLTTLIAHAGDQHGAVLRERQATLREVLVDLDERNERNKLLLRSSILSVQKSIDFISGLMTTSPAYGTDGTLRNAGSPGRIVCRKE